MYRDARGGDTSARGGEVTFRDPRTQRAPRAASEATPTRTVFLVARRPTPTNVSLLSACHRLGVAARIAEPEEVRLRAAEGDIALARLDVRPTLDGVEAGLWELRRLGRQRVRLLNEPGALLTVHDKLATALRLAAYGIPHPRTAHIDQDGDLPAVELPVVAKPRFGSWGRDVALSNTKHELDGVLRCLRRRTWFQRQGVLLQELVPPRGYDLRLLVVRGEVIGAIERVAAPGEWRTNVALGAQRRRVAPPPGACALALAAAAAVGADFVGVDLLPASNGGWVVLELNGAVDFTPEYALDGRDIFDDAARLIMLADEPLPLPLLDELRADPASALLCAGLAFRHCGGFRVHSPDGHVGFVEDVLFGCDADRPAALAVRSGLFRPRVELVALEDIVEILPSERRLVVRALPPS